MYAVKELDQQQGNKPDCIRDRNEAVQAVRVEPATVVTAAMGSFQCLSISWEVARAITSSAHCPCRRTFYPTPLRQKGEAEELMLRLILQSFPVQLRSIPFLFQTHKRSLFNLYYSFYNPRNMSKALASASVLKPEIRLAQAVAQFEADLSSEQKATFQTQKSQFEKSPPDESDVMRLTAEINRASLAKGGRGGFGPRMSSFLRAIQQFAAIGDVLVGGSQNIFACGIVSKPTKVNRVGIVLLISFSGL